MKKIACLILACLLPLALVGCSSTTTPKPETPAEPAALEVSDLSGILADLNAGGATLQRCCRDEESSYPADRAIRAAKYIEALQGFTWESYQIPESWDWENDDGYRCTFDGNGITLTAYQGNVQPLHAVTENGEGWFVLPYIEDEADAAGQGGWMLYSTFEKWWNEAQTAESCRGSGTPLSADELDWFEDYTASEHTYYDEEHQWTVTGATEISCFFTSTYDDPRDMDAERFLQYFPTEKTLSSEDEAEFALVQKKLNWRSGEDDHLFRVEELPVPCHRIPRAYLDEVLMKYAGIKVAEMHTDWLEYFSYIPETDCFYTFTSDFGPGMFVPYYGEKDGTIVTLWSVAQNARRLTLQKSGESWHILSLQSA